MATSSSFEGLVSEALAQELVGWDFSFLNERWIEASLPWDYRRSVSDRLAAVSALLDMGTGGGEFLSSLAPLPPIAWATEAYPPNVPVAHRRLASFNVQVVQVDDGHKLSLPFADHAFDLVINRHESFNPFEVYRILKPGGRFITQQVGGENCVAINRFLGDTRPVSYARWNLENSTRELREAGFRIEVKHEVFPPLAFLDVGAVVFYLKAIPWQIEGFRVDRFLEPLKAIHDIILSQGQWVVAEHRFFIEAFKP